MTERLTNDDGRLLAPERRCAVCGGDNACAVSTGAERCWCAGVTISPVLKDWLAARGIADRCLCPQCATGAVPSPCINVCELDSSGERCVACRRTLDEIGGWSSYDAVQKAEALLRLRQEPADGQ
ncbi:MAG: cysteine-rich CWC family protein [Pseudomonadota bacterium]